MQLYAAEAGWWGLYMHKITVTDLYSHFVRIHAAHAVFIQVTLVFICNAQRDRVIWQISSASASEFAGFNHSDITGKPPTGCNYILFGFLLLHYPPLFCYKTLEMNGMFV